MILRVEKPAAGCRMPDLLEELFGDKLRPLVVDLPRLARVGHVGNLRGEREAYEMAKYESMPIRSSIYSWFPLPRKAE